MPLRAQPLDLHQLQARRPGPRPAAGWAARARARSSAPTASRARSRRRAARPRIASRRRLAQDAGEREVHALQRPQHAGLQRGGRVAQGLDQLVGALVALAPLADAAVDDLLEVVAAGQPADLVRCRMRARASPFTSIPRSCPTWYTSSRACHLGAAPATMSLGAVRRVEGPRGDPRAGRSAAGRCRSRRASGCVPRRRTRSCGVRSRCRSCPRWSFPSTWRMPAISRRAVASGQPLAGALQERAEVALARVLQREAVEDAAVRPPAAGTCRRRGWRAGGRPGAARSRPRAASRRCAR